MPDYQGQIDIVLRALNKAEVRATYTAVGEFVGLPAISVSSYLGTPRPEASWVVAKSNELPSRYRHYQYHSRLTATTRVIGTGRELAKLVSAQSPQPEVDAAANSIRRIAGVDLAWNTESNGSGLAIGRLSSGGLTIETARGGLIGLRLLKEALDAEEHLVGVAVDAPLIIKNATGSRPCEKGLSSVYSRRWAGCYPSNLTKYPNSGSVMLSRWLEQRGFDHLEREGRWQVEVYPHPALIELFSLDQRLAYKKGTVEEKRAGQARLTNLLCSLADHKQLPLFFADHIAAALKADRTAALPAGKLKENEDMLDAIVCCYVGALFALGMTTQTFGDTETGYIVVP